MKKKDIPNMITFSRMVLAALMILPAYLNQKLIFILIYTIAILTDKLDGTLARKYNVAGTKGARLDAIADEILLIALILSIILISPEFVLKETTIIIYIACTYIFTRIIIYIKQKKISKTPMTLYLSRFNVLFIHSIALYTILSKNYHHASIALKILAITATLCRIEETLIHLIYKKIPWNIHSIFFYPKNKKP